MDWGKRKQWEKKRKWYSLLFVNLLSYWDEPFRGLEEEKRGASHRLITSCPVREKEQEAQSQETRESRNFSGSDPGLEKGGAP